MTQQLPWYVTKFETVVSKSSSNSFIARGVVTTGPNLGVYVTAEGTDRDLVIADFLKSARVAYASSRKGL